MESSALTSSTRERALEGTESLLEREGYRGVSMEAVAQVAGIRKASLYHHFPGGKDELMLATVERAISREQRGFAAALGSAKKATFQLEALMSWIVSEGRQTERMVREAVRHMPEAHQNTVREHFFQCLFNPVHAVLEQGVAQGEFRPHDTEMSALAFMALLSEMGHSHLLKATKGGVDKLLNLFIHGVQARSESETPLDSSG